ncbi:MAG: lysine-2,3-aminomutase-like protein [Hyphomicrobiaceae bacterium]
MNTADKTLRSLADLAAAGLLSDAADAALAAVAGRYAVAVTPAMATLVDTTDPADPIARQFVPDARELVTTEEERADPIGDGAFSPVRGVVHRYRDRALLKVTGLCPVYCRFCFRREMVGPGGGHELSAADLDAAIAYLAGQSDLFEVIVTGGDPLVLSPRRIADIAERLGTLPQISVVRWHTRVPVVAPERVTADLIRALRAAGKAVYIAVHANHPRELTPEAVAALARLADAGLVLLGQTVLLRGVNDDPVVLAALMRAFVANRVKPYYLHHPDLAPGTGHFRLPIAEGQAIVAALRGHVSGLAQPTYVLDVPDGRGKVPIGPSHADVGADATTVTDLGGRRHRQADW